MILRDQVGPRSILVTYAVNGKVRRFVRGPTQPSYEVTRETAIILVRLHDLGMGHDVTSVTTSSA